MPFVTLTRPDRYVGNDTSSTSGLPVAAFTNGRAKSGWPVESDDVSKLFVRNSVKKPDM